MSESKIMIDIETLGTKKTSLILSVGAVEFNDDEILKSFHVHIDPDSCEKAGLTMDARTVLWWLEQSKEARDSLFSEEVKPLGTALAMLDDAFDWSDKKVWCKGADFDFPILENAYAAIGLTDAPWKYYNKMDFRTLRKLVPPDLYAQIKVEPEIAHNALFDAYAQAETTQNVLRCLNWGYQKRNDVAAAA